MKQAFYSEKQLDHLTQLSRVTRWRMRQSGEFPNPVRISSGRVAYPAILIDRWVSEKSGGQK